MKTSNSIALILLTSMAAMADLTAVNVPVTMLHSPNCGMNLGYTGKVEYTLSPLTYDSVYVSLAIKPVGGTPLTLKFVKGDVGAINVNIYAPNRARQYEIFFEASNPQPGVQYVAEITANPAISAVQADITAKVASLTKSEKTGLCAGGRRRLRKHGRRLHHPEDLYGGWPSWRPAS